jgi:hypothetical protein
VSNNKVSWTSPVVHQKINQYHKGASEITIDYVSCIPQTEDPSPANADEISHPAVSFLPQNVTLHCVVADLCREHHYSISNPPSEKETTHAAETESFDVPAMAAPLLNNESHSAVKPNFMEWSDNIDASLSENDGNRVC